MRCSQVHADYVDCVQWVGNLLVSKSTSNKVVLWKPNSARRKDAVTILRELGFADVRSGPLVRSSYHAAG